MKTTKQNITSIFSFLAVLLVSQSVLAFYDPSTGRWLSRDPIGEPGFQALQRVRAIPQASGIASTSGRWIHRDRPDNENRYLFVGNNSVNHIDPLGLLTFEGCSADQQQKIQNQWNSFCQQAKSSSFKCCLNHFNIPQRLAAMCDRADTKVVCDPSETSSCGWSYPFGRTVYLGQLGLSEDPGCGPIGCTLLHEMTHLAGHWPEKWADRVENCLQGCPKRPAH